MLLIHRTHHPSGSDRGRKLSSLPVWLGIFALLGRSAVVHAASPAMILLVQTGAASPVGWLFSGLSAPTIDADGRAVFAASSSAVFVQAAGTVTQKLGAGTTLGDGRKLIGANAPALDGNGCIVARALLDDGGQAIVRGCAAAVTVVVQFGDPVDATTTIAALDPTVFAVGADTVAFSGVLSDGSGAILRHDATGIAVIARLGQSSPAGGRFSTMQPLGVTSAGRVGFRAVVSQGPNGLFAGSGNSIDAIVLVGQGSPIGGSFSTLADAAINPSDKWAFRASLSTGNSGVFLADASTVSNPITVVAIEGGDAPIPNAKFRGFPSSANPSINAAGIVAFRGLLSGVDASSGVFVAVGSSSSTTLTTTNKQTEVGTLMQLGDPAIADDGSVVLPATVTGRGPGLYTIRSGALSPLAEFGASTTTDVMDARYRFMSPSVRTTAESAAFLGERDGIFRRSGSGTLETVAYTGERTPVGGSFASFDTPVVDGRGRVVFGAAIHQGQVKEAVFAFGGSGLGLLVKPGQRASGGGKYSDFFPSTIDDSGRPGAGGAGVALTAVLKSTNADEGVFMFGGARGQALARSGQHVRGGRLAAFGTPAVGSGRQVVFVADVGRKTVKPAVVVGNRGSFRVVASEGDATGTRVASDFVTFDPPTMSDAGAVFRATLDGKAQEALFLAAKRSLVAIAAASDVTTVGDRIRTFADPVASGNAVYVLARLANDDDSSPGLFRVVIAQVPAADGPQLPIEPLLRPTDVGPSGLGGTVARINQPGVGPFSSTTAIVDLAGAKASSALVWITPDAAPTGS